MTMCIIIATGLTIGSFFLGLLVSRFILAVQLEDIDRRLDALNEAERNVKAICAERGHEYEWDERGPGGDRCVRCGTTT